MDGSKNKVCHLCDGMGVLSPELDYIIWGCSIPCPACTKEKK